MLNFKTLIPGLSVASIILIMLGTALGSLCFFAIHTDNSAIYLDSYLIHVIWITVCQAILSTLLSVFFAILLAKALTMIHFRGKSWLLRIMPITFILPSLVVVTGLLSVYGQHGIVTQVFHYFNMPFSLSIYGLQGILLAHLFLNFPYACCLFYQTIISVPIEQKQLASQLNFTNFDFFKLVEWPLIRRQLLPIASLIFMLCFSSFAIVLALGGGPKYTTIEVAIYQSIRNFELIQAVLLSGIQLLCCLGFMWMMQKINRIKKLNVQFTSKEYNLPVSNILQIISAVIVVLGGLFILMPMITILVEGIYAFQFSLLTPTFKQAMMYSTIIALGSAIFAIILACLLLWTNSRLLVIGQITLSNHFMLVGSLILAIPSMVLASGLFLSLFDYVKNSVVICLLMIFCNALMALPYLLKNLATPMYDITSRYWQLTQSLSISGFKHFYLIEFKGLRRSITMSFAYATILSLGDFGIIALFGGQGVITLPYYLYEQISHYHHQQATVTASFLLVLSFSILVVIDYDRT